MAGLQVRQASWVFEHLGVTWTLTNTYPLDSGLSSG